MATAFVHEVRKMYPGAAISVIAKKGLHELLDYFPATEQRFVFDKEEFKGFIGLVRFGKMIKDSTVFDLFFSLPDSFSSAVIGFASGAKKRIGFKNEARSLFLTHSYKKPGGLHRVNEYISLLELFTGKKAGAPEVWLQHQYPKKAGIVVNINSEAQSRRLTVSKAVEEIKALRNAVDLPIVLIGAPKEKAFVAEVFERLEKKENIENLAGNTALPALVEVLASASLMLSTDSGPAHLANALGTKTVVLFGAGNENNTAPYNTAFNTVIRLNQLSCEPCLKNVCVRYKVPQCLQQLDVAVIINKTVQQLQNSKRE